MRELTGGNKSGGASLDFAVTVKYVLITPVIDRVIRIRDVVFDFSRSIFNSFRCDGDRSDHGFLFPRHAPIKVCNLCATLWI